MKAITVFRMAIAIAPVAIVLMAAAGCSSNNTVPKTLAEQRKAVAGGPIPPSINAKYAAMYAPGGSAYQQIHGGEASAGAAKQGATGSKPNSAPAAPPTIK